MPTTIDRFQFVIPKTVPSGSSLGLQITVTVSNGPKTLSLTPSAGYTISPTRKVYDDGLHVSTVNIVVRGPSGTCIVEGELGNSNANDAVEVT